MESAKPFQIVTPNIEQKKKAIIDIKEYDINLDNKLYKLVFGKSEDKKNIIFKIYEDNNNLQRKFYLLEIDLEKFFNLNIIFKLYSTIDEIYNLLLDIFINKKYIVKQQEHYFILILQFSMPGGKNIDFNFNLPENIVRKDDLIENLYSVVTQILKENKLIKEENEFLKKENELIKERLNNIEKYIDKQKEKEKEYINVFDFNKSKIIKDRERKFILRNWINKNGPIKNINLIYRASEDGDRCDQFFNKCRNKGPTVSLIKTKNNRIFGGFTTAEWNDKNGVQRIYDNKAFLFSLDNIQKYIILKPEIAIACYPNDNCLVYGNKGDSCGICIAPGFLKVKIILKIIR